eukprot:1190155-Prorocentrum_minimum.AAC.7
MSVECRIPEASSRCVVQYTRGTNVQYGHKRPIRGCYRCQGGLEGCEGVWAGVCGGGRTLFGGALGVDVGGKDAEVVLVVVVVRGGGAHGDLLQPLHAAALHPPGNHHPQGVPVVGVKGLPIPIPIPIPISVSLWPRGSGARHWLWGGAPPVPLVLPTLQTCATLRTNLRTCRQSYAPARRRFRKLGATLIPNPNPAKPTLNCLEQHVGSWRGHRRDNATSIRGRYEDDSAGAGRGTGALYEPYYVDAKGYMVDVKGCNVNAKGYMVDVKGCNEGEKKVERGEECGRTGVAWKETWTGVCAVLNRRGEGAVPGGWPGGERAVLALGKQLCGDTHAWFASRLVRSSRGEVVSEGEVRGTRERVGGCVMMRLFREEDEDWQLTLRSPKADVLGLGRRLSDAALVEEHAQRNSGEKAGADSTSSHVETAPSHNPSGRRLGWLHAKGMHAVGE